VVNSVAWLQPLVYQLVKKNFDNYQDVQDVYERRIFNRLIYIYIYICNPKLSLGLFFTQFVYCTNSDSEIT
jgi:hypothetical protein